MARKTPPADTEVNANDEENVRPADGKALTDLPDETVVPQALAAQPLAESVVLQERTGPVEVVNEAGKTVGSTVGVIGIGETQPGAPIRPPTHISPLKPEDKERKPVSASFADNVVRVIGTDAKDKRRLFINLAHVESTDDDGDELTFGLVSGKKYSFSGQDAEAVRKVLPR